MADAILVVAGHACPFAAHAELPGQVALPADNSALLLEGGKAGRGALPERHQDRACKQRVMCQTPKQKKHAVRGLSQSPQTLPALVKRPDVGQSPIQLPSWGVGGDDWEIQALL